MITGVHTMFYSSQPEELRAFLRDKLGFSATDVGDGWLIFDLPDAEMGCHPADTPDSAPSGTHSISFYCDDLERTVADLKEKGVEFTADIIDAGWGLVTHFRLPGDFQVQLYQPRYQRNPRPGKGPARSPTRRTGGKAATAKRKRPRAGGAKRGSRVRSRRR
jgi:catechol 2,3-dioxygenase-like lactoylglutathione lyase family enzyme